MKKRTDFVTNSSSSSFIIGRDSDNIDKDFVFHLIQGFYQEYLDARDALMKDCKKYKIHYDKEKGCFEFDEGGKWTNSHSAVNKQLEDIYGISTWDYFPESIEWLRFESYKEYEKYWLNKYQELKENPDMKKRYIHAPFSIVVYNKDKSYYPLHNGGDYCEKIEAPFKATDGEVFYWYVGCVDEVFSEEVDENFIHNCENCSYCHFERNDEDCQNFINGVREGRITADNAIHMVLGSACIHSECGYIPDFVVEKLSKMSNYWCNHMG